MPRIFLIRRLLNKFYYRARKRFFLPLFVIDLVGYLLIHPLFLIFRRKPKIQNIKKILIIRLDNIGDTLLTTPCFRALKKSFPHSQIDVLVRSYVKEIATNNPNIDNIYILNPTWLATNGPYSSWLEIFKMIKNLRKNRYDIIFEMHGHPLSIVFAFLLGGYRIGYGILGLGFLLHKSVYYTPHPRHIIERNLDLVRILGANDNPRLDIFLSQNDIINAEEIFGKYNLNGNDFLISIHPGVSTPSRSWPEENFSILINKLVSLKENIRVLLCGSNNDKERISKILKNINHPEKVINLSGQTNIIELALVIKKSQLLIGLESLAVHLASAFNIPTVTIFSGVTTKSDEWGPYGPNNIVIQRRYPQGSIFKHYWKDNRIMKLITAEEVFNEAKKIIDRY